MINCLGTVAFRNNVKLPVKTLKLLEIFCLKHPQEFVLNLHHFTLVGKFIQIFDIDQNTLSRFDCIWEEFCASMISFRTDAIS